MSVPAGFNGGFALARAKQAIDKGSQEKKAAVSYRPARTGQRQSPGGIEIYLHFRFQTRCRKMQSSRQVTLGLLAQERAPEDLPQGVEGMDLGQI